MRDSIYGKISKGSLILLATVLSGAVNAEVIFATDTTPNPTTTAAVTLVPFDSIGRLKPQNTIGTLSSNPQIETRMLHMLLIPQQNKK
ncbi:MAG: hypothetical protein L3J24_04175 [Xanthomonadales bacterium]|nr:hypothetical protein [Xanthomonadales bacterium]